MHLLNRYALSCGLKIDNPFILEHFYPIPLSKYVIFQTSGKGNSRQYDYWSIVFKYIRTYAPEYKIIQIGLESDQSVLDLDLDLRGKTSIKQLAYLIKNSSLYLGVDSFSAHLAGHYNKKIVSLYSYCYAQNSYPIWGDPKNKILLEVDWSTYGKPSFSVQEKNKKINTIKPEKIAKSVLDLLQIPNDLDKVETIHIGENYHLPTIEIVPDSPSLHRVFKDKICNVRMDYYFDEKNLHTISQNCSVAIITEKEINLNLLANIRNKIYAMTLVVDENTSIDYIESLKSLGIKLSLIAKDSEKWQSLAEKFFDFNLEKEKVLEKKDIKNIDKIDEKCMFSSQKVILSRGKVYSDKCSWNNDLPKVQKYSNVIDDPVFWEESEHLYIYKDERNNTNNTSLDNSNDGIKV